MLNIFPTVMKFGNLDLTTGKEIYDPLFISLGGRMIGNGVWQFDNGAKFDLRKGEIRSGDRHTKIRSFVLARLRKDGNVDVKVQPYKHKTDLILLYAQTYRTFIITDVKTFRSMYVQMFLLGRYDKRYFEPVVVSPYTRIYKVKR
jgi:dolichyl-diphosphooligosaccharide--protein glycosyltransferase/undecaprenyl-diphosphooligosaccharide--protein glycosyltransferase